MRVHHYPGLEEQIKYHKTFVERIREDQKKLESGGVALSTKLLDYLRGWLIKHIQGVDKQYEDFFARKGIGRAERSDVPNRAPNQAPPAGKARVPAEEANKYLPWSDEEYGVGIAKIDAQHKKLVGYINTLHEKMLQGRGNEEVMNILDELASYVVDHFGDEETLMRLHKYPEFESHLDAHKTFIAKVTEEKAKLDSGSVSLSINLLNFLKAWLVNHIKGTDRKYKDFFASKGVR